MHSRRNSWLFSLFSSSEVLNIENDGIHGAHDSFKAAWGSMLHKTTVYYIHSSVWMGI